MCAKKYRTIVADPPWHYEEFCQIHTKAGRTVKPLPYPSVSLKEIMALNIKEIAQKNCRLFLWTTNKYLPAAFSVLGAWGFEYKQTIIWHKVGNPSPWGGSIAPNHVEFLLVANRGKPRRLSILKSNVLQANVSRHSAKPDIFYSAIESVSEKPAIELFARPLSPMFPAREGWDVWGNEVPCSIELGAQNTMESGSTAYNRPSAK